VFVYVYCRLEHNVVHSCRHRRDISQVMLTSPRHGPAEANENELSDVDEEVAPRGASVGSCGNKHASMGAGASLSNDICGANMTAVDVGRSAEQSTEMFRSLRSLALHLHQGLAEMEELLDSNDQEEDEAPSYDAPAMTGPASVEGEPPGGRMETKAKAAGRKNNRHKALRYRMVQQVQLLFNELDRHGGAERLVASASKGAGSADCGFGESDDCPGGVEILCETTLREMSLDEVCEALSAKGLDMYVSVFQREVLDGARLAEMDESALLALGLDRGLCSQIRRGIL
jgi:hypothetical protein